MTILTSLVNLSDSIHLCLSQISCISSGLALLEEEQKFKLGGCVGDHEMAISYANTSRITLLTPYLLTKFHDFCVYLILGAWNAI
jgi:hypothetical protein